jgi:hypothetical protein
MRFSGDDRHLHVDKPGEKWGVIPNPGSFGCSIHVDACTLSHPTTLTGGCDNTLDPTHSDCVGVVEKARQS